MEAFAGSFLCSRQRRLPHCQVRLHQGLWELVKHPTTNTDWTCSVAKTNGVGVVSCCLLRKCEGVSRVRAALGGVKVIEINIPALYLNAVVFKDGVKQMSSSPDELYKAVLWMQAVSLEDIVIKNIRVLSRPTRFKAQRCVFIWKPRKEVFIFPQWYLKAYFLCANTILWSVSVRRISSDVLRLRLAVFGLQNSVTKMEWQIKRGWNKL